MMDQSEIELFQQSISQATANQSGSDLDRALDELGWSDALSVDPQTAIAVLFESQGSNSSTSSAIGVVLTSQLFGGADRIAMASVFPALNSTAPPATVEGASVTVEGVATSDILEADVAMVVASRGENRIALEVPTERLSLRTISGIDPNLGLVGVTGLVDLEGLITEPLTTWARAIGRCQVSISHELVGASKAMLAQACEHALEREQFGQPIGQFQAVRHRLADALIAIEMADAMLEAAWLDESPHSQMMAKSLAGRGARTVVRHSQQVLAGIGFTTEHPLHLYIKRALVLDEMFGSSRSLTRELGEELLASGELPPLAAL